MHANGEVLLVSILAGALLATAVWIVAQRFAPDTKSDLIQRIVPSAVFITCVLALYSIGSRTSFTDDGVCLICGKRSSTITLFGVVFERSEPPRFHSHSGPEYRLEFKNEIGVHSHDWVTRLADGLYGTNWFVDATFVRDRPAARVWVAEFSSWPRDTRVQALRMYEEWHPQWTTGNWPTGPDWAFTCWRDKCLLEHPEWLRSARSRD